MVSVNTLSINTLCYEGICRIYRNAVVNHIRTKLRQQYPDDWRNRIAVPFGEEEWATMRDNALIRRNTGELGGELKDEADLLSVNHFYNLFDLYFDDLFPDAMSLPARHRQQSKQAILGWARNIKNLRDPAAGHPAEEDVTEEDASMWLDSARRILSHINLPKADRVREIRTTIRERDIGPGTEVVDNQRELEASTLPSRELVAPNFVGRRTELEELNKWLHDPYSRVWLLAGDGGKGKTAIAYEFAITTLQNPPVNLEIVIWLSAKARRFVSGQSVDIETPDFEDLESALDWVLRAYGAVEFEEKSLQEKEEECRVYLSLLPALIILDDVDSLEGQQLDPTMSYFLYRTPGTKSKILLTSRRVPLGMEHTQVKGFDLGSPDGVRFIRSRIKMYGLESDQFPNSTVNDILQACDGSPLFVQDLLRLCLVGEQPGAAIQKWKNEGGEAARRYALEREFEMLSEPAKKVLLSCALYEGPVSLPEIQVAGDISEHNCHDALQDLQNLFLVPRPHLVEGVPRFALNVNTRQLVLDVLGKSDMAARILSSIKVVTGQIQATPAHRQRVGQYIRQAVTQVKLDEHANAEETLLEALNSYPENTDLLGTLGWVYKTWNPRPRRTDARNRFARAAELKSSKEDTYRHWWEMERDQHEWSSAAEAAETGLANISDSERLSFMAGFARSQFAKDLYQQAQYSRAERESVRAETHLRKALLDLEEVGIGEYRFHSSVHRATVINYEYLVRISRFQGDMGREGHFLRLLSQALGRWENEHPNDPNTLSEKQRLVHQFPGLRL